MNKATKRFEILIGKEWVKVTQAAEVKRGWLHWEIRHRDGAVESGLSKPDNWRLVARNVGA